MQKLGCFPHSENYRGSNPFKDRAWGSKAFIQIAYKHRLASHWTPGNTVRYGKAGVGQTPGADSLLARMVMI